VLLHVLLAAAVILSLPWKGPPPEPRGFEVALVPLQLPPPLRSRASRTARAAASPASAAPATTPAAVLAAPAAASPNGTPAPGAGAGEDQGRARLAGLLRGSFGCSEAKFLKLAQAEQDRCERFRRAHVDPNLQLPALIPPEKRAWFEAALASRHSPGRLPAFGCGVLIDGVHLKIPKTPPHSLKLGPLPCYVLPPKGPLDDEVDAEAPSRHDTPGTYPTFADPNLNPGPNSLRPY